MSRIDWESYALELAFVAAERSEDPWVKVGCCILRHDNSVAGLGYNGAPPGIEIDWGDRDDRRKRVVHAEVNALRYSRPGESNLLACTYLPCGDCIRMIASYGIKKIVYARTYEEFSLELASQFNIELLQKEPIKHIIQ